ncbi:MAG: hypothetical protein M1816_003159 [Peltula sp. TS41687]|nr:MAG: hypothetical protein M1816_003159 [Peltula sp. TS41687]
MCRGSRMIGARKNPLNPLKQLSGNVMGLVHDEFVRTPARPLRVYGILEVEAAFRFWQNGKNTGKTVVEMRKSELVPTDLEPKPSFSFDVKATYVISGALESLG